MKFTLRDLFWLVLVAALGCAWWIKHQQYHALAKEYLRVNWRYEYIYYQADRSKVDPAYNEHPDRPLFVKYLQDNSLTSSWSERFVRSFPGSWPGIAFAAGMVVIAIAGLFWRRKKRIFNLPPGAESSE